MGRDFKWVAVTLDGNQWFMVRHFGTHWIGWGMTHPTKEAAIAAFVQHNSQQIASIRTRSEVNLPVVPMRTLPGLGGK